MTADDLYQWGRIYNTVAGIVAMILVIRWIRFSDNWANWRVYEQMGALALVVFCLTTWLSTLEILVLSTQFRVGLVSIAVSWVILGEVLRHFFEKRE